MSAPDEGLRADAALSSENLEQTPAERLEAIETRLAGDLPERPRMGELAIRAEALAEAHAMAPDHPERVSELVPAIARTIRIAAERTGKGQRYLLGSYEGEIYRDGLATLAALNTEQLGVGDDDRVEQVMQAVCTVLTRPDGTAASHHAIPLLGTIAVDRSGRVADWLSSTGVGTSNPRSLANHIATALRQTDEVEKRRGVLRAVAVLVVHERLHSLVDDLSQAVLDDCGAADDATVQAWTHVVCIELDRDSPVDPADLWQQFRYVSPEESIAWWLLLEYSGPALPIPDHKDATRFEILTQHTCCRTNDAVAGAFTAAALPDALLRTPSPMQQAATLLEHEDRTVRHAAACQVVDLITRADVPKNHRTRAVEILGGKQLSSPTARSSGLAALVRLLAAEDTPPALRRRIFDSLVDTIRNTDSPGVRAGATDAFDEIATQNPACVSTTTLDHAVQVVTTLFDHEETFVRRGGIAALASLASIERVTSESISRAVNDLIARLDNQDPAVRRWAAASLSRLAFSDAVSTVQLECAVETLAADLQHDDHKVRARTIDTLGDVIGDVAVDTDLTTAAVRTLLVAITDERSPARMRAVEGLRDLKDVEHLTGETLGLVVDALADTLNDEHPPVGHKAAAALGTLTAHSARRPTHLRTMAAALRAVFRDGGHAKGQAVWALGELLAMEAITGDIAVRIVDTLEEALGNHYFFDSVGPKIPQALGKLVVTNSAKNESLDRTIDVLVQALQGPENSTRTWRENSVFVERRAVDALGRLIEQHTLTTTHFHRIVGALEPALDSSFPSVRRRAADALADCALDDGVPADAVASLLDSLVSLLDPDDDETRQAAARGIRAVCQSHPVAASRLGTDRFVALAPYLSSADTTTTAHLLAACQRVAARDSTPIIPLTPTVRQLLAEANPSVQSQALDLLSLLGASISGHESNIPSPQ